MTAGWRYGPLLVVSLVAALVASAGLPLRSLWPLSELFLGLVPVLALLALVHRAVNGRELGTSRRAAHLPAPQRRRVLSGEHRASDADRETAVAWLREAATEGRLDHDELEERAAAAFSARTYADLERVLHDLPLR